jgi:hypothetical protein
VSGRRSRDVRERSAEAIAQLRANGRRQQWFLRERSGCESSIAASLTREPHLRREALLTICYPSSDDRSNPFHRSRYRRALDDRPPERQRRKERSRAVFAK